MASKIVPPPGEQGFNPNALIKTLNPNHIIFCKFYESPIANKQKNRKMTVHSLIDGNLHFYCIGH